MVGAETGEPAAHLHLDVVDIPLVLQSTAIASIVALVMYYPVNC